MASSIHIKKAVNGIINHNSREGFSHSVVFTDEKNELLNDSKEAYKIYRNELAKRTKAYSNRTNQKLQKNAITHLSAIVNLEQHHNLNHLNEIKNHLEKELDTKVFQMSIHRDEGKLISKEDDNIIFTSGEDFFKNPDDDILYWDKKYTNKINMNDYNVSKNYHAHMEMLGLDTNGTAIKRSKLSKYFLSNLQTLTAKSLNMERGKNYYQTKTKAPKRLDVLEFKKENKVKREAIQKTKNQTLAKVKDLNNLTKELRLELASSNAESEAEKETKKNLIRQFDQTKKELHSQVKNKDLTIEELENKILKLRELTYNDNFTANGKPVTNKAVVEHLQKKNEELKAKLKEALAENERKLIEIDSKIKEIEILIYRIKSLEQDNKRLESQNKLLKAENIILKKESEGISNIEDKAILRYFKNNNHLQEDSKDTIENIKKKILAEEIKDLAENIQPPRENHKTIEEELYFLNP